MFNFLTSKTVYLIYYVRITTVGNFLLLSFLLSVSLDSDQVFKSSLRRFLVQ